MFLSLSLVYTDLCKCEIMCGRNVASCVEKVTYMCAHIIFNLCMKSIIYILYTHARIIKAYNNKKYILHTQNTFAKLCLHND